MKRWLSQMEVGLGRLGFGSDADAEGSPEQLLRAKLDSRVQARQKHVRLGGTTFWSSGCGPRQRCALAVLLRLFWPALHE